MDRPRTGLSVRAGSGGFSPAIRVWHAGYGARMKADIKSSQPEVKASKSVKTVLKIQALALHAPWTPHWNVQGIDKGWHIGPLAWIFWPVMFMASSSMRVHSRLSMFVQPPFVRILFAPIYPHSYPWILLSGRLGSLKGKWRETIGIIANRSDKTSIERGFMDKEAIHFIVTMSVTLCNLDMV